MRCMSTTLIQTPANVALLKSTQLEKKLKLALITKPIQNMGQSHTLI